MSGNVWEWVGDWYGDYPSTSVRDSAGPSSGLYRVFRGGAWHYNPRGVRTAFRDRGPPGGRYGYLGFRLVRGGAVTKQSLSPESEGRVAESGAL